MYQPAVSVLFTSIELQGFTSVQTRLCSNGTYLRSDRNGQLIGRDSRKGPRILFFAGYMGETYSGVITDKLLVARIEQYVHTYLGVRYTNCSAFAHFLTVGSFIECREEQRLLVIEQGMRPYEMADNIDVGDMVCLIYANDRLLKSRTLGLYSRFRRVQKHRHATGGFCGTAEMGLTQRSFTADEIRVLCTSPWSRDYHFMVCVAKKDGKPIWLSQAERARPGEELITFAVTYGARDPYFVGMPLFSFVKKRR